MTEHLIRLWKRYNGTWDVTHHKEGYRGYLWDVPEDYKSGFKTRKMAEKYALKLFKKFTRKGNLVTLESPEPHGQEIKDGGWVTYKGGQWTIVYDNGNIKILGDVPKYIWIELNRMMKFH